MSQPDFWHIALTEPRAERHAAVNLRARRYQVYYPVYPKAVPNRRNRTSIVIRPMYPGYLFVRIGGNDDYGGLCNAPGIRVAHSLLMKGDILAWVPPCEINRVMEVEKVLCDQIAEAAIPPKYEIGQVVKLVSGPLIYFTGPILEIDETGRVVIGLSILGHASRTITTTDHVTATLS